MHAAPIVVSRSGANVQLNLGAAPSSQAAAAKPVGGMGVVGPAWTRGEIEKPSVTVSKGSYSVLEYSSEQQQRLGVDAQGKKVQLAAAPSASPAKPAVSPAKTGSVGVIGPAWTRGEIEAPAGTQDMGGWQAAVYTPEQQKRLNVDAQGNKVAVPAPAAAKVTVAPLPDKWESRTSAFSVQKYWFNGGKNSVSLRDPSKMVGGQLAHAAAAAAASSVSPVSSPAATKPSPAATVKGKSASDSKAAADAKAAADSKAAADMKAAADAKAVADAKAAADAIAASERKAAASAVPDSSAAPSSTGDASGSKKKKKGGKK